MLILILILFIYALYEYQNIAITYLKGKDFKKDNPFMNKRILFISDIQYDLPFGFNHRTMQKLTNIVNSSKADYIVFGGDFIHKKREYYPVFSYIEMMKGIKIAVLGNHDYYDKSKVLQSLNNIDVSVLINQTLTIDGISFVGVDDLRCGTPRLPSQMGAFNVLLTHEPDFFETLITPFNIALAGHLHGGQVTLFGKYAPILPTTYKQKYRSGMVSNNTSNIYVTKGLGGSVFGLPIRFFAKPEVVIIDI